MCFCAWPIPAKRVPLVEATIENAAYFVEVAELVKDGEEVGDEEKGEAGNAGMADAEALVARGAEVVEALGGE